MKMANIRRTSYKSIISFLIAIFVSVGFLCFKTDYAHMKNAQQNISVVFLQMGFTFSIAMTIYLAVLYAAERFLNCCFCKMENKSFPHIIKKFTARSIHVIISVIMAGFVFGVVTVLYLDAPWNVVSTSIGVSVLAFCLLSQEPTTVEISAMWENENVNIGYGLAKQYFNGYIKVLMSSDHDWEDRIASYSAEQDVPIFRKLILLLPRSCKVWCTLREADKRIYNAQNLQPKVKDLSGIRREFNSTVWKINEGTRFVAEYPPPLATIQEMCYQGIGHPLSDDKKREQFNIFSYHLQDLIKQDPYCCSNCVVICYDDTRDETLSEVIDRCITNDELDWARSAS